MSFLIMTVNPAMIHTKLRAVDVCTDAIIRGHVVVQYLNVTIERRTVAVDVVHAMFS